jgi:hypothetical protein
LCLAYTKKVYPKTSLFKLLSLFLPYSLYHEGSVQTLAWPASFAFQVQLKCCIHRKGFSDVPD